MTCRGEDRVPFVDVAGQNAPLHDELIAAVDRVIRSGSFIGGSEVDAFEAEFAARLGVPRGVGCSSGTSALSVLLEAAGIGPGDEVITTPHTFIATAAAIVHVGATPVFADIEPRSYNLDPAAVEAATTARTRAVLLVHLYGTPGEIDALAEIAGRHGCHLFEDAAQAHGATFNGRPAGALADAATFSFYPAKNLGAFGDAGFIASANEAWLDAARSLIDHGRTSKYVHDRVGYNHRIDAVQAALLRVKLRHLDGWIDRRRAVAAVYDEVLRPAGFKVIEPTEGAVSAYHLYVVEVANRDQVLEHLRGRGIGCGIHYPVPLHLQPAFAHLGLRVGDYPVAERAADRVLSLPIDGELATDTALRVANVVREVAQP